MADLEPVSGLACTSARVERGDAEMSRKSVSLREIEQAKTERGGWTRETLAKWGVAWPPPKGWKEALMADDEAEEKTRCSIRKYPTRNAPGAAIAILSW